MQAIGYCRISKQEETDDKEYYILAQQHKIKEYCKQNDIEILQFYSDVGVASEEMNKPVLNMILAGNLTRSPIECLIIENPNIISNDIDVYFTVKDILQSIGIKLVCTEENLSTEDLQREKLVTKTFFLLQKYESQIQNYVRAHTVEDGRKLKAFKGGYSGGKAPFGYKVFGGKLVIDPDEADTVKRIFELRDNGLTLRAIANQCYNEGRTTRKGTKFNVGTIKNILDNKKTYEGYYHYKGLDGGETWVKGEQEPILKEDEF